MVSATKREKMKVNITVVMPAYRESREQISQAIESILRQTYTKFEYIIVLDDPHNNDLQDLIEEYANRDKRIKLYVNEKNGGCPYSKDRGIRLANSEYIAIMDSDDLAYPQRLERQLEKIEQDKLDLIASYVRVVDEDGFPLYNMDNLPLLHEQIAKKMKINNCLPHPTWFLKKEMYLSLGGYTNIQGCEDYDFLIRAINAGYQLGVVNEILLDYRLSTHSVSRNNLYRQYLMMQFIQDKYYKHQMNYDSYEEFESVKYTEEKAMHYAKASVAFEKGIEAKARKQYLKMLYYVMKTFLTSKEYAKKIVRYILQELN